MAVGELTTCKINSIVVAPSSSNRSNTASDILPIDSASIAFSELLEELALTDKGVPLLNEIRKMYAPSVEDLRSELKALLKMKDLM
jgi:hypothetical protein